MTRAPSVEHAVIARLTLADVDPVCAFLHRRDIEAGGSGNISREAAGHLIRWAGLPMRGLLFGARIDGEVVGFCRLDRRHAAPTIGVVEIAVLSAWRRRGLGERLMRVLLAAARRPWRPELARVVVAPQQVVDLAALTVPPVDAVWLCVDDWNHPARRLYEKLDFEYRPAPFEEWRARSDLLAMRWTPALSRGPRPLP